MFVVTDTACVWVGRSTCTHHLTRTRTHTSERIPTRSLYSLMVLTLTYDNFHFTVGGIRYGLHYEMSIRKIIMILMNSN